jgi:hypothetical protein
MKNTFKFEVSFNLNTASGEKLDMDSIRNFRDMLEGFVRNWSGENGYFYAHADHYDTDIFPTSIKVRRVK